jgi:small multidrug resistance family-3 protein
MTSFLIYIAAAVAEIGGCFAFWAWLRLGRSVYWVFPGVASLMVFALLLTRIESIFAGRTFAAYGGVYIAASVLWLWVVEGQRPDRWDVVGSVICLVGAGIILLGPRPQI